MQGLIDGILFGLAILFLIRLYTSNDWFYRQVNQLFYQIQSAHFWLVQKSKCSRKWKVSIFFAFIIFGILSLAIFSKDIYYGILFLLLVFVPGLYIYGEQVKAIQADPVDQMIDRINQGLVSKKDLDRLRHTIKHFYTLIYAPQQRDETPPGLLLQLFKGVYILVHPRLWKMYYIPVVTKYSLFSSFFYNSPFHHRQKPYFDVYNTIHQLTAVHPFRLQIQQFFIDDSFAVIEFRPKTSHSLEIVTKLARVIEKKHHLEPKSLNATESEGIAKLFIPREAVFAD